MKTILVTGGAGFLGSHLCKKLLDMGHKVICIDNFSTGDRNNIKPLIDNYANFIPYWADISISLEIYHNKFNEIYNLACPASPVHYQSDPIQTTKTNVCGILKILELARVDKAKILQASTSEVYGNPTIHPQVESYNGNVNPIGIRSCYDEGKRCAETLMFNYWRQHKTRIKVARIFNTYGPHMQINDGRVVSNMIVQALQNKPITIYGDGSQTRSFCYVDDTINGLISLMNTADNFTGPVNIGNPVEYSILDLVEIILGLIQPPSHSWPLWIYKDLPADDPLIRQPDITLAKEVLNWEPKIDLKTGLLKTIKYFKEVLKDEQKK